MTKNWGDHSSILICLSYSERVKLTLRSRPLWITFSLRVRWPVDLYYEFSWRLTVILFQKLSYLWNFEKFGWHKRGLFWKFGLIESQDIGSHLGGHREAESSRSGARVLCVLRSEVELLQTPNVVKAAEIIYKNVFIPVCTSSALCCRIYQYFMPPWIPYLKPMRL